MPIAVLSIDLEARLGKLEQGFNKAVRIAERDAEKTRAAWARAGAAVTGVAGSIAGLFAGYSVVGLIQGNVDAIDSLNDVADATGASIENISALEDVAKRTGGTLETASSILLKFNKVLGDAEPGSAQADALRRIGLSAAELRKLDPAEALRVAAVALSGYANEGEKARMVQTLFGKSVAEAAPFLKDLAEQGKLNAKVTTEQAEAAEKFNKNIFALQANLSTLAKTVTNVVVPSINGLFDKFGDNGIKGVLGLSAVKEELARVRELQGAAAIAAANVKAAELNGLKAIISPDAYKADIAKRQAEYEAAFSRAEQARQAFLRLTDGAAGGGRGFINPELAKPNIEAEGTKDKKTPKQTIDEASQALARYVEQQQRELAQAVELTEQQQALNFLRELGATGEIPQVRELVLGMAQKAQLLKDETELQKALTDELKRQADVQKSLDDAIDNFSGRTGDDLKRAQTDRLEQRIRTAQEKGQEAFTPEELNKIVKGIAGISDEVKDKLSEMDEFAKQSARNIQDSLGTTLKAALKGDYDGILDLWADTLLDMAAQAAALQLNKYLFGDFGKTGDIGGLALKGLQFFGIPGFASGGDHAGGLRLVGERGPELEFTGPSRIVDANRTQQLLRPTRAAAAGSSTVNNFNISIPIQAGVTRAEVAQLIPTITEQVTARVAQATQRPGSRFAFG
ncbi:hypothetical protein [Roseateles cavernae]|uniref:hypothetical protein n=1 Tax=Roseateles cavernae TaxID=3153578 RepID=UPI0032E412DC